MSEQENGGSGAPVFDFLQRTWGTAESLQSTYLLLWLGLLGGTIVASYLLRHRIGFSFFPDAAVALAIGILWSGIEVLMGSPQYDLFIFSPKVFFFVLLPPILFNSGYHVHKNNFFANIGAIFVYSIVSTII